MLARARGASVRRFRPGDVGHAERPLRGPARPPVVLCMDGVNSMTGNPPDLAAFADLARRHDALLYVDDAHGFGVIGERTGYDPTPYGRRGNAVVRWAGESYEGSSSPPASPRPIRRCWPSWPFRPGSKPT